MAVKLLYYFVFFFIAVMVFLLYKEPYKVEFISVDKNEPNMVMIGVTNYSLSTDGVAHIIKSTKVLRFVDHDEFLNVDATRNPKEGFLENLKADHGVLIKDDLKLRGNVRYINSKNEKFTSEKIDYNLKTKIAKTDVDFTLEDNRTVTRGTALTYDTINGKTHASNIKSIIEEEQK